MEDPAIQTHIDITRALNDVQTAIAFDPYRQDEDGDTILHHACIYKAEIIPFLKDHTIQNLGGSTPLHYICSWHPSAILLLKWHEVRDGYSSTVFAMLRLCGWSDTYIHVLAKLRRLLGTLPAAFIRLVHSYT